MRLRVRYSGHVQGVGFRATAHALARRQAVTGWVRNEPDGDVLMEVQGEQHAVNAVLDDIRREMGRNIRGEDASPISILSEEASFVVRR